MLSGSVACVFDSDDRHVASRDGLELLVGAEPAPQPSAASEDERERMDFPDDAGLVGVFGFELGEVGLGLLAGFGLEAALEPGRRVRPDRAEIIRHRRIAEFLDLPEQPASGQIRAVPALFGEIGLVRLQEPGPRLPRRIGRSREAPVQKLADRLAVQARPPRDRADRRDAAVRRGRPRINSRRD